MINDIIVYYSNNMTAVTDAIVRHFLMATYGVLFAVIVAVPLAFVISNNKRLSNIFLSVVKIIQTVPALALLSLLIIVVGLGPTTVVYAVFIYALLPILSASLSGINEVPESVIDVAQAMGMSKLQIIFKVKLPLSMSIIIGGIRSAYVVAIGVAAVGTFIGAGGLGDIISRGLNVSNGSAIIWAGALPTALMAVFVDLVFGILEKVYKK